MHRLTSLTGLVALAALGSMPAASPPSTVALVPARAILQEPAQESDAAEAGKEAPPAPTPKPPPPLSVEDKETLELLRSVLAEEGREAARELLREIVRSLVEPEPGEEEARVAFLLELDRSAKGLGSLEESLIIRSSILDVRTRLVPPDHPDLLAAKQNLAMTRYALGDFAGARELEESVLEARTRLLPSDHPDLLAAKGNLAVMRNTLGDFAGALELKESVLEARTRLLPPDHPDLLAAKGNLAVTRNALGDFAGALELEESVLEARTRLIPPDHPDLLAAKGNLAVTRNALGDFAGALELKESVLEARTRLLPPDHPDLLAAKQSLAVTRNALGDFAGALELKESVLEARTRLLPPDHPDLLAAKQSLAVTRSALGDFAGALELEESVLEARTRLLPPDHPDLLAAKGNLAVTRNALGDLAGALELEESVLEARTRLLPPDHPDLLAAKLNLAATREMLGDLVGARELREDVLERWSRLLPPEHPDLLRAKGNLALSKKALGDLAGARELLEAVLETWTRLLPSDHPDLLRTKQNLAATRYKLGDLAGALELDESVLEARTRLLPPDHPDLLVAKLNLATTRERLGDLVGGRELQEDVLERWSRLLPSDHPHLLVAKEGLAGTRAELGDLAGAHELVSSLLEGVFVRARALRREAARPAREGVRAELQRIAHVLFLSESGDPALALERQLFAVLENLRLASAASAEATQAIAARPELAEIARGVGALRSRLNDLVAAGPEEGAAEEWRRALVELAEERDRAERRLRAKLVEAGSFDGEIDADAIGGRLAPGTAAVSFLRYARWLEKDPETKKRPPSVDSLLAFVVRADGPVRRIELGPAAELEELVSQWRKSLGKPIERRTAVEENEARPEPEIGRALRARLLDPLLAAAGGGVRELHVVLDDLLHLVPLDALPLEGEERVGERLRIHVEPTLARLLIERRPISLDGTLVMLGGTDFEAEPVVAEVVPKDKSQQEATAKEAHATSLALLNTATPPTDRGGRPERFEPLGQTHSEAESIAKRYRETFATDPVLLTGAGASKAALFTRAPRARFLHIATHGWFAPETFKSQLDALAERGAHESWQRAEETLIGFAPETLCGLALAGANRGRDALGRVPGILTAEELSALDLRNCELAVLSACETNVGIRRAGQGIQSLQTALHAAGARTAITSLWKVDDAATQRLFELFYTKLWKEGLGKAEALWQSKMALRAERRPLRDWAGWVLSGDPD